ncbi:type I restriction enzyme M protein [Winogradskyella wandonensis]|uniref:site-specific DNA-methyltransferase (adenine-specific) n=1 Tax=Winogradskyella wandonensis TaxID=1442586 RepID=A0A4R1KSH2_9FLAO|nr:N-6 DNA methylase [Winogradskyella wandonensis]TCK67982.1 type I restriction enzyme M protein [Winogradskyella wandonensis]
MLDTITKKRIDDCRDILVGKLPDPKAQIEQITIGLIYKFMADMDKEAIDLGGKAKFFSDYTIPDPKDEEKEITIPFSNYSWDRLFDTKVTASEMLRLYSEAIESMEKNPNIPQLFRDIFNNAYLPYRDPETLKLFLKTIGEFEYTHSEKLGDAFEYLLSVMGSQGDAGQFRTPRHIIDFLVAIVDPSKTDTVMDPACGTAGFLISAFKYIKEKNNNELTPDQRKKLIQNFVGYDISPDMVRLSLVNLYLHGFSEPHIFEYDTLSSEERWNENFDVILANPPFMSPKGGIRPHKKFTINSKRSEVLFVDYIAEHLNPKGRAGIIVPEGIIFQGGTAYKDLRKMLVENYLYAVVSLPAGVFNPYSGVKTSIILLDKELAKKSNEILFIKIDNDGYSLGSQRGEIKGGQLEQAIETAKAFKYSITQGTEFENTTIAHSVDKKEIGKNGDYNLSGERYKLIEVRLSSYPIVELGDYIKVDNGRVLTEFQEDGEIACVKVSDMNLPENLNEIVTTSHWIKETSYSLLPINSIVFPKRGAAIATNKKRFTRIPCLIDNNCMGITVNDEKILNPRYLFSFMRQFDLKSISNSAGIALINNPDIKGVKIPLPPISIQEEIVSEIEDYQKIIDGAKMVVDNYKPNIDIDPDWDKAELNTLAEVISGYGFSSSDFKEENLIKCIKITNVGVREFVDNDSSRLPETYLKEYSKYLVNTGDLVISLTRTIISTGLKVAVVPEAWNNTLVNQRVAGLKPKENANLNFIYHYLCSDVVYKYVEEQSRSLMQPNLSITDLKKIPIPNPPIETQNEIVARIENEQKLVNANKELIEIFEQKIKNRIAKVWGE